MPREKDSDSGTGYIDYLLLGKDNRPLAIVEAKRTMYSPQKGIQQARLYARCLENEYGYRPPIFLTNGFETFFLDDDSAKRTMYSPQKGIQQARLYARCLENEYGYRPPIFLTNGFETFFLDDDSAPMRKVSGFFSQDELQRIINRRSGTVKPSTLRVNETIAGGGKRYYQVEAIERVCANIESGHRKSLLVMATGTGKTRV